MADLKISQLAALAGANLAAGDLLPVVDVSASETKKITITDAIGYGVTLIADATIPGAKIVFNSASIPGSALANSAVGTTQLADDGVTAAKLANESTVDLVTTLPASGAFTGQLALDTDDLKVYCWDGSAWQSFKAAGSVNSVAGSTTGIVNVVVSTVGDTVTVSATLDNTSAANQFLAGPTGAAGAPTYRAIDPLDLPTASTTSKGAVQVNGEGLRMDGNVIEVNNDVVASGAIYSVVNYDSKGLITAGRAIQSADLPAATSGAIGGVYPGTGLSVAGGGQLNHTNTVTAATATKITYDAQGHVTGGAALLAADIPDLDASKITTGSIATARLGDDSVTGAKLANSSTAQFGANQPIAQYTGQLYFNSLTRDIFIWDGNVWQPIGISVGEIILAGTYNASTNLISAVTPEGAAIALAVGQPLPASASGNTRYYVVVSTAGTGTAPAPTVALAPPDILLSTGSSWVEVDVSQTITAQVASNIGFTPYGNIASNNVQSALQEIDDEKLAKAGGTVTGELLIGVAGTLVFEGATDNTFETTLGVVDPTADRSILLPNVSGTVITTGDTGSVTNTMLAGSIADSKLATITTAGKVDGAAVTGTIPSTVLGNSTHYVGTTAVALNRASANQALTGISSIALPGATSGTITVTPAATAGTTAITVPATTGTLITSGDTSTVTNTMLAGSIADTKLSTISTAGKVSNSATTATNLNTASAIVARDASGNFTAGTITASLTGTASSATALATARTINGTSFDGTANITTSTWGTSRTITVGNTGKAVDGSAAVTWTLTEIGAAGTAVNNTFTVAQRSSISALTDGVTITPDFATANNYSVTLAGNRTLANPTNQVAGQSGSIFITQDATGSRTLAYGANWDFAGGTAPTLSTAANAIDRLDYIVRANGSIHAVLTKAFS